MDAILVKGMSRPVDSTPTKDSTNLVTSGGVKAALDEAQEIHVGSASPTGKEVIWLDPTSNLASVNYVLLDDASLNVSNAAMRAGKSTEGQVTSFSSISDAINALPKNLNGYSATINVAAGTYNEDVVINGFTGGKLILKGESDEVNINRLELVNNTYVSVEGISLNVSSISAFNSVLHTDSNITVTGDGASTGIELSDVSRLYTDEGVTISIANTGVAVKASSLSSAYISTLEGTNNIDGIVADSGSNVSAGIVNLEANILYSVAHGSKVSVDAQPTINNY